MKERRSEKDGKMVKRSEPLQYKQYSPFFSSILFHSLFTSSLLLLLLLQKKWLLSALREAVDVFSSSRSALR